MRNKKVIGLGHAVCSSSALRCLRARGPDASEKNGPVTAGHG